MVQLPAGLQYKRQHVESVMSTGAWLANHAAGVQVHEWWWLDDLYMFVCDAAGTMTLTGSCLKQGRARQQQQQLRQHLQQVEG